MVCTRATSIQKDKLDSVSAHTLAELYDIHLYNKTSQSRASK